MGSYVFIDPKFFIYKYKKIMKKWAEDEKHRTILLLESGLSYKNISEILNRTVKSIQRKLNKNGYKSIHRNITTHHISKCKCCEKEFKSLKKNNQIFCSKKCCMIYLNKERNFNYNETKISKCIDCNCDVTIKGNTNYTRVRCNDCKEKHNKKICKYCGNKLKNDSKKIICDICKPYLGNIKLYEKLNIINDNKKITKLDKLNKIAIDILSDMYYNKKYSRPEISEITNIDKKTIYKFFIKNNFKLRTLSESTSNAIYQGRLIYVESKNQYKSGWHKTWNDDNVYCRSSYELDYCLILDKEKIEYTMEKIRIKYWDSLLKKERIAIPDFYLPKTNEIIEIKSTWTYDENNMKDKILSYKNNGYLVKLILDHNEYLII